MFVGNKNRPVELPVSTETVFVNALNIMELYQTDLYGSVWFAPISSFYCYLFIVGINVWKKCQKFTNRSPHEVTY